MVDVLVNSAGAAKRTPAAELTAARGTTPRRLNSSPTSMSPTPLIRAWATAAALP